MRINGFDQKYSVKKKIKETGLYSIYLISAKEQPLANDEVLLIEHSPAQEPSTHILPIKINDSSTMSKISKDIVEAIHAHFTQREEGFY